jgi:hypothetical protein
MLTTRRTLIAGIIPAALVPPALAAEASAASPDERWADRQIAELSALTIRCERTRLEGKLAIVSALLSCLTEDDPSFDHVTFSEWDDEIMPRLKALEAELRRRSERARQSV